LGDFLGDFSLSLGDFYTKTSGHPAKLTTLRVQLGATVTENSYNNLSRLSNCVFLALPRMVFIFSSVAAFLVPAESGSVGNGGKFPPLAYP
jgi:hypothetical protein